MTCGRAIDGDEPLLDFDGIEGLEGNEPAILDTFKAAPTMPVELFDMSFIPQFAHLDLSSFSAASTPAEVVDFISRAQVPDTYEYFDGGEDLDAFKDKGKAVSRPMDILPRDCSPTSHFDLFSFNGSTSGPSRQSRLSPLASSSVSSPQSPDYFAFSPTSDVRQGSAATSYATDIVTPGSSFSGDTQQLNSENIGKGKSRAGPPSLPPILFSPTAFSQGETSWPLETTPSPVIAGSSRSHPSPTPDGFPTSPTPPLDSGFSTPVHKRASRHRSFSSLTTDSSRRLVTRPPRRSKLSLISGKRPSNLARKLLSRNDDFEPEYIVPSNTPIQEADRALYSSLSAPTTPCISRSFAVADTYTAPGIREETSTSSHFEFMLPKEIKLEVLQTLLRLHEADGELLTRSTGWTALKAAQKEHRWIGREKGIIELVLLSRVSKSWQRLVFDGQLWHDFDLKAFPNIPLHLLRRLAASSGSFIRSVDLTGHTQLTAASLLDLTNSFCISYIIPDGTTSSTQLTSVNLSGCSGVTTRALHDLIVRSPFLVKLNVKGLSAVTNETCKMLAIHCLALSFVDFGRCHGMDAYGMISFFAPHGEYRTVATLRCLRLAGLKRAGDKLLSLLGQYAPNLEVLDLSGARELHNTALEAFVACFKDGDPSLEVLLTSREAGRDPGDPMKYRRRVTKLRHLSLSYCPLLTGHACSHLAYAVPKLEFLELAGVGAELKDDGLIRLLNTTPLIRRLDLDEACELTDATLATLTPQRSEDEQRNARGPEPGSRLEVLNLSYAVQLTNDAILALIRSCTRLVHLELDSTRVTGTTVKEFVRLSRKRQAMNAKIVVVDCRHVGDSAVKDLAGSTRTRKGWRAWEAQYLHYLDARDDEALGVGTDECDEKRVALKSFYQWQTVDAVEAAREKRRKVKSNNNHGAEEGYFLAKRSASKWWSPGSRRGSGSTSPVTWTGDREREGCIIM